MSTVTARSVLSRRATHEGDTWARKGTVFGIRGRSEVFFPWTVVHAVHVCHLYLGRGRALALLVLLAVAFVWTPPALAKDGLGVFGEWAAFRDPAVPRCYAIAAAEPRRGAASSGYADVGTWPKREVRGQVHFRLSRTLHADPRLSLAIGGQRFALTGGGIDAWAGDRAGDAAIVAAMRSAPSMSVSAVDSAGRRFTDRYSLDGVATAMDAATVGCARIGPSTGSGRTG